ncbi:MAG: tetratricopeptide repeat protein, partial [Chloroflexi bacterium]|nr:tetratricopeptide repeat protein [Chloroflexota bacterium]
MLTEDSTISPVLEESADVELARTLLDQILAKAPPQLAEGLYLASISHTFTTELMTVLRARNDGKDQRLVERLLQFSFVWEVGEGGEAKRYSIQGIERDILNRLFIEKDRAGFIQAHRRALEFHEANPNPDQFLNNQSRLFHLLFVDPEAALDHLMHTFRVYNAERRLAAADRLLVTAEEVQPYLVLLNSSILSDLENMLAHLHARLDQLRGNWAKSLAALKTLRNNPDLSPTLVPYVARGYGYALARSGMQVEAIDQYRYALATFAKRSNNGYEQGLTMIHIGDAYRSLAIAARGHREVIHPLTSSLKQFAADLFSLLTWLPLVIYLSFSFGWRLWLPQSWPMLRGLDWIIARLFATGSRWYRRAAPLLAKTAASADKRQAEEKMAYLHLTMGDLTAAIPAFQEILKDETLSEYNQAQVTGLYAEANYFIGKPTESVNQYNQALSLYQRQKDVVGLTEVAERLKEFERDQTLGKDVRTMASTTALRVSFSREYLLRFKHPVLVLFRFVSLVVLFLFFIIVPLLTVHFQSDTTLQVSTSFHAVPVLIDLLTNDPNYSPSLSQQTNPEASTSFKADVALQFGVAFLLLYLVAYTVLGLIVIAQTRLSTLQRATRSSRVSVDLQTITVGEGDDAKSLKWTGIKRILFADALFNGSIRPDSSSLTIITKDDHLSVSGNIAWYEHLRERVQDAFSTNPKVTKEDVGYQVVPSKMAALYGVSFITLVAYVAASIFSPRILDASFWNLPYTLVDGYPYIYIGLFLPPAWWGMFQQIRVYTKTTPRNSLPFLYICLGLLLAATYWLTPKPWFITPDYFVPMFFTTILACALYAIWIARDLNTDEAIYPIWGRLAITVAVGAIMVASMVYVAREVIGHHYVVIGNHARSRGLAALALRQEEEAQQPLEESVASYTQALIFSAHNMTALNNRAASLTLLKQYEAAVADYDQLILKSPRPSASLYANRALAKENWAAVLDAQRNPETAQRKLSDAIGDFDRAIAALRDDQYYLRRGVAYHTLGDYDKALKDYSWVLAQNPNNALALAGTGWVYYSKADEASRKASLTNSATDKTELLAKAKADFQIALTNFQEAVRYSKEPPELEDNYIAVGYAYFRLEDYEKTLAAWQKAVELAPKDPITLISRATAYYKLGTTKGGGCGAGKSPEVMANTAKQLSLAIDDLNAALKLDPTDHFTYRTRGQLEFLLASCQG